MKLGLAIPESVTGQYHLAFAIDARPVKPDVVAVWEGVTLRCPEATRTLALQVVAASNSITCAAPAVEATTLCGGRLRGGCGSMFDFGDARLPERFWAKVQPDEATGCWLWLGARNKGYGVFRNGGSVASAQQTVSVHRTSYQALIGPIPHGLQLDHLCRVRYCINPSHLEPVTQQENIRRGDAGRHESVKTHCPRGHAYDEVNTMHYRGRRICRACGNASKRARRLAQRSAA